MSTVPPADALAELAEAARGAAGLDHRGREVGIDLAEVLGDDLRIGQHRRGAGGLHGLGGLREGLAGKGEGSAEREAGKRLVQHEVVSVMEFRKRTARRLRVCGAGSPLGLSTPRNSYMTTAYAIYDSPSLCYRSGLSNASRKRMKRTAKSRPFRAPSDRQPRAVSGQDVPDDRQAEARAGLAGGALLHPVEALGEARHMLGLDALAEVPDIGLDPSPSRRRPISTRPPSLPYLQAFSMRLAKTWISSSRSPLTRTPSPSSPTSWTDRPLSAA